MSKYNEDSYIDIEGWSNNSTLYDEKGFVHRVCEKGHYWKDQEFSSMTNEICRICGGLSVKDSYHDSHSMYDLMSEVPNDDSDEGNRYLES